jgi:exopolysaccharide biosynthesis protein
MDGTIEELGFLHRKSRRELREAKKRQRRRKFRGLIIKSIFSFILLCFVFIGMVRIGIFPGIQEFVVTSAMTTLSHQYLADIVANRDRIQAIMESNKVIENYENFDKSKIKENGVVSGDRVELTNISRDGYTGYMLTVTNPKRIFLGTPKMLGAYGSKISTLTQDYNAIAGVNAGGFSDENGKGRGGTPTGIIIQDVDIKYVDKSIDRFNIIGFSKDNILVIGQYTLSQIKKLNLRDAVNFRPFLILNGKPVKMYGNGGWGTAPRTAIGQREDGTVLLVVIDGRQLHSAGATMKQMQEIMLENGAVNAANLDGGSSSVMQFNNEIINSPSSPYGDRYLPSAFLINGDGLSEGDIINKVNN